MANWIYEIAYGLGGAVIAFLVAFLQNRRKKNQEGKQYELDRAAYDLAILKIMSHVRQKTSVKRFMIFKGHNGGIEKYASALYADCEEPFEDHSYEYRPVQMDEHYRRMLNDLPINNPTVIVTEELPFSMLRRIYENEGVALSYIYFLHERDGNVYYCSLATDKEGMKEMQTPKEMLLIDLGIGKLKRIFTKKIQHGS